MQEEQFRVLLEKYMQGKCNEEEIAWLEFAYLNWNETDKQKFSEEELRTAQNLMWLAVNAETRPEAKVIKPRLRYVGIAAAVAAITLSIWLYTSYHYNSGKYPATANRINKITPGKNTATLSINGRSVQLSEAKKGVIIGNEVTYNDGTSLTMINNKDSVRNIAVTTPRGGTYQIVLQEGTKVWLNSDTKLEFLSSYRNESQRIVKLEGEGYFEVAKDKNRPFIVESSGQRIKVLGTHFNVNSYKDEAGIKTTLLEGSVIVSVPKYTLQLKPGEQAIVFGNKKDIAVRLVDTEEVVAWKNGYFRFYKEDIESIMKKVARWYDVSVEFKGEITTEKFNGTSSRTKNINEILEMLETTNAVHFKIEGRRVMVMK